MAPGGGSSARSADDTTSSATAVVMASCDHPTDWNSATGTSATAATAHFERGDRLIASPTSPTYTASITMRPRISIGPALIPSARPTRTDAVCGRYGTGEPKVEKVSGVSSADAQRGTPVTGAAPPSGAVVGGSISSKSSNRSAPAPPNAMQVPEVRGLVRLDLVGQRRGQARAAEVGCPGSRRARGCRWRSGTSGRSARARRCRRTTGSRTRRTRPPRSRARGTCAAGCGRCRRARAAGDGRRGRRRARRSALVRRWCRWWSTGAVGRHRRGCRAVSRWCRRSARCTARGATPCWARSRGSGGRPSCRGCRRRAGRHRGGRRSRTAPRPARRSGRGSPR